MVENGRRKTISKRRAIVAQLVNQSAKADLRAIKILLGIQQQLEGPGTVVTEEIGGDDLDKADLKTIERYLGSSLRRQRDEH